MTPPEWLRPGYGRTMLTELAVVRDTDPFWELAAAGSDLEWHDPALSASELAQKIERGERPTLGWVRRSTVKP